MTRSRTGLASRTRYRGRKPDPPLPIRPVEVRPPAPSFGRSSGIARPDGRDDPGVMQSPPGPMMVTPPDPRPNPRPAVPVPVAPEPPSDPPPRRTTPRPGRRTRVADSSSARSGAPAGEDARTISGVAERGDCGASETSDAPRETRRLGAGATVARERAAEPGSAVFVRSVASDPSLPPPEGNCMPGARISMTWIGGFDGSSALSGRTGRTSAIRVDAGSGISIDTSANTAA